MRVPTWFQGPTGSGQGGWTAQRFSAAIGEDVSVAIRAPIPLETDLDIVAAEGAWHLVDPTAPERPILIATPWDSDAPGTTPISIELAAQAATGFPLFDDHPVPVCFSCGLEPDSMQVHCGPLDDGRWATDWTVPAWATDDQGNVNNGALWAAIDCAQAWFVGNAGGRKHGVTVQLAVDVTTPLVPGATYALVAWNGDYDFEWDGRKRGACGAVFDSAGTCVARSRSFWVSPAA